MSTQNAINNTGGGSGAVATDTLFDAKGDLPVGTGADTAIKLTVGANDTILMADSAQSAGLKWGSPTTVKTALSLNNVTNESKATMFASPTFTGTTLTDAISLHSATGGFKIYDRATDATALQIYSPTSGKLAIYRDLSTLDVFTIDGTEAVFSVIAKGIGGNPYNATTWNGSFRYATEDDVRDKIESLTIITNISDNGSNARLDADALLSSAHNLGTIGFHQDAGQKAIRFTPESPASLGGYFKVFNSTNGGNEDLYFQFVPGVGGVTSFDSYQAPLALMVNEIAGLYIDSSANTIIRYQKRIGTVASSATPTPDFENTDQYNVTALAVNATFGAPTGTFTDGMQKVIRIKDNGTTRTLAFNAVYRVIGVTLPTATTANKTIYLTLRYNQADVKWDVVQVNSEV